jgi:uncharacterized protein
MKEWTMTLDAHAHSAGLFARGLVNLKAMLVTAEAQAKASSRGEAALLEARLSADPSGAAADLHGYALAAQVHWAAEGARLAIGHLLGAPSVPVASEETSFVDLHQYIDATLAFLRDVPPSELESALGREVAIRLSGGGIRCSGEQFLVAYAIPHFYYHVATAYGILRNQDVHLSMGDYLGNWGTS